MTIKAKILSLVAAFALLAAAITGLGLKTMADYDTIISDYNHASENAFRGERLNRYLTAAVVDFRGIYMSKTQDEALLAADRVDVSTQALETFLGDWRKSLKPNELPEFAAVDIMVGRLIGGGRIISNLTRTQSLQAADAWGNKERNLTYRLQMQAAIGAMVERIEADQMKSRAALEQFKSERQNQFLMIAIIGILMVLAGSVWIIVSSIAAPLSRVRQSIINISEGAYDTPIPTGEQTKAMGSEIGELWRALGVLKAHAVEVDRLSQEKLKEEQSLRELVLD
jgi:methyl-accepting chemotaxis protein